MRLREIISEVKIDNKEGAGAVPYNQDVDYFGLRVMMKPSTFLKLAAPLGQEHSAELEKYIADGGAIGAPFLDIKIPMEWDDGNFSKAAQVVGHEGRNRMTAILKLEGDAPIEVHMFPKNGYRGRDITPEFKSAMAKSLYAEKSSNAVNGPLFEDGIDEGWKDTMANAAIVGGIALGGTGGMMAKDAYQKWGSNEQPTATQQVKTPTTFKQTKTIQAAPGAKVEPAKTAAAKAVPAKHLDVQAITGNPLENVLLKTAKASGLVGAELAAFLAQCAHETLDFKALKEFGGSLDFRKYDPKYAPKKAKILGNVKPGDGAKYKGRGFIQLTGRDNYRKAGAQLGLPLEKHPEMVEDPKIAAQVAVWFWKHRVQPNVDNFNDVNAVTKMINPAMRGLEDRTDNFKNYMQVAMR